MNTGRWNQQKTEMSVCERVWGIHIKIKTHRIIGGRNAELLNMGGSCSCYPELSITLTNIYQNRLFPKVGKTQKIGLLQVPMSHLSTRARSTHILPYRHFIASVYFWVILMGITFSHTLVTTSKMSIGFLSKIDAALLCSRNK